MRIAVVSDVRLPTLSDGPHGLGRSAHDIASGLAERGHDVTLFAGPGSAFSSGCLIIGDTELQHAQQLRRGTFDGVLDTSHQHHLSRMCPDLPIVNRLGDRECKHHPPNAVVNSRSMQAQFPQARLVRTGVKIDEIPFFDSDDDYLAFMSAKHAHKGFIEAIRVAERAFKPLRTAETLTGEAKWACMGRALGLLHPSTIDAAPRTPLEAAACGTPTLCLDRDGTQEHVAHGVTGYVCADWTEMVVQVDELARLDRASIRQWVADTHGYGQMIDGYEALLCAVADGERW